MRDSPRGFSRRGVKIGRRGAPEVGPTSQAPWWRGQGWGRATWPPGRGVAPLRLPFGDSGSFRLVDFYSNFSGIFGALLIGVKSLQLKDISRQERALGALS